MGEDRTSPGDRDPSGSELLTTIADALHGKGAMPRLRAEEMLERLGVDPPSGAAASAWETHGYFEEREAVDYLDGHVSDERLQELSEGSDMTEDELTLARNMFRKSLRGMETGNSVYLYSLKDDLGRTVCFISVHGDGGDLLAVTGPFATEEAARLSRGGDDYDDQITHVAWY
jgi:hypothetical protein